MFNPPNIKKYKKKHKFSIKGFYLNNKLKYGKFGLKAIENGFLNYKQIESARKAIIKQIKKIAKIYINLQVNLGITKKPTETRMGKGKGNIVDWVCAVKSGKILFEIKSLNILSEKKAKEVLYLGAAKLPIKTIFKKNL
jgi:large subunit ribosomal protein L16